jgi:hypothetical protein
VRLNLPKNEVSAPLRQINGFLKILQDAARESRSYLKRIQEGARRIGRMPIELVELSHAVHCQPCEQETGRERLVEGLIARFERVLPDRAIGWRGISAAATPEKFQSLGICNFGSALNYKDLKLLKGNCTKVLEEVKRDPDSSLVPEFESERSQSIVREMSHFRLLVNRIPPLTVERSIPK